MVKEIYVWEFVGDLYDVLGDLMLFRIWRRGNIVEGVEWMKRLCEMFLLGDMTEE